MESSPLPEPSAKDGRNVLACLRDTIMAARIDNMWRLLAWCVLAFLAASDARICDVRRYGAKGDNKTDDTLAIQSAVDDCADSLGTVVVPDGVFLTRPIQLRSGIHLFLDAGSTLMAWPDLLTWPNSTVKKCSIAPYQSKPVLVPQKESLLHVRDAENVKVTGLGTIDGQGWRWWPLRTKILAQLPPPSFGSYSCVQADYSGNNPQGFPDVQSCFSITTLERHRRYNIAAHLLSRATITGVTITAPCGYGAAPNTDGINLSGEEIHVSNCSVTNGDDCVPINVGGITTLLPSFQPRHGSPDHITSDVLVEHVSCRCGNGVVPIIWKTSGRITNVTFRHVLLSHTNEAVTIKSLPAFNGTVNDVLFEDIVLDRVATAININEFEQISTAQIMKVANITLRNITGTASTAGNIRCSAVSGGCTGLVFDNVVLQTSGNYSCEHAHILNIDSTPPPCQSKQ